jgi:hypothetical protein
MRNAHIVKRSVLGSFGVKIYVMKWAANLSIGTGGLGETPVFFAIFANPLRPLR